MPSLSLDKYAYLLRGKIVVRGHNQYIPFSVSLFLRITGHDIVFVAGAIPNEKNLIAYLRKNRVQCVVLPSSTNVTWSLWKKAGISVIKTANLRRAFRNLARFNRRQHAVTRVQVIGSSGKTTTKEMIGAVLDTKFNTLISRSNYNSPRGVAYNLLRLNEEHQTAVFEAGIKGPGIMRLSSRLIRPDIGVVTCIHRAHFARFGSISSIIKAKAEILEYLPQNGTLIINWDDVNCRHFPLQAFKGRIIRYGLSNKCDLRASDIYRVGFSTYFTVHTGDVSFPCKINIIGDYNVGNALAAVAVGLKLGMTPKDIVLGLENFKPANRRMRVYTLKNGARIVDDSFNANPDSTRMLIDQLISVARDEPLSLVIGDMERPAREINKYARRVHYLIGRKLAQANFSHILAIGLWAREYVRGAVEAGFPREKISYCRTVPVAQSSFKALLEPGTTTILKASPYVELWRLRLKAVRADRQ